MKCKVVCIFFFISLLLLNSCQIEKRQFRSGYHITSLYKKKKLKVKSKVQVIEDSLNKPIDEEIILATIKNHDLIEKNEYNFIKVARNQKINLSKSTKSLKSNKCDIITFRTGEDKSVKVIEINDSEVKYRNCDNLEGPLYITKKTGIFRIIYANGTSEVFEVNSSLDKDNYVSNEKLEIINTYDQKSNFFAIAGLVLGILSIITSIIPILGLFFGILGYIFGLIGSNQINKQPTKYRGERIAKAAMICSGIGFSLAIGWFIINFVLLF